MRFEILFAIFGLLIAGAWSLQVDDAEPEVDPAAAADALLAVDASGQIYDESERHARGFGGFGVGIGVGYGGFGGYGGYGGYGHHHHHHDHYGYGHGHGHGYGRGYGRGYDYYD